MVDRCWARLGANVEENTDVGLENRSEGVKEPTMGVDLLLVLFFEAEDDLDRNDAFLGTFYLHRGRDGYLGGRGEITMGREQKRIRTLSGILVYMGCDWFSVDNILGPVSYWMMNNATRLTLAIPS